MRRNPMGTLRGAFSVAVPVVLMALLAYALLLVVALALGGEPVLAAETGNTPLSLAVLDSAKLKVPQAAALTRDLESAAKADQERAKATKADLEQRSRDLTRELGRKGLTAALRGALTREQRSLASQLAGLDRTLLEAAQRRQEAAAAQLRDLIRSAVSTVAPGALVLDRAAAAGVVWQMPEGVRDITADVQRELDRAGKGPAK